LHTLLQTHGDAALRTAFEQGLTEQAIGAEYIAHYLDTTLPPLSFTDEDRPSTLPAPPRQPLGASESGRDRRRERSRRPL